jgi:hypothetical protein
MLTILINLLVILVVIAVFYLVLYLFQKWVMPIDGKIVGILLFIAFAILVIYAVTNKGLHWF